MKKKIVTDAFIGTVIKIKKDYVPRNLLYKIRLHRTDQSPFITFSLKDYPELQHVKIGDEVKIEVTGFCDYEAEDYYLELKKQKWTIKLRKPTLTKHDIIDI
tara:strand:+ start:91 stop:396 length:306 start_codon:yes stop_codon:yes gene_type:complete